MNVKEIIKIACIKQDITICDLAGKIGTTKQNLYNKMNRNDFKLSDIEKIFSVLEIKLKVFDKDGKEL